MNIFVLSEDPIIAAQYHCDKHVPKMILESAQMLSTVLNGPYLPAYRNHPCTLWVAESRENAMWLSEMAHELNSEFRKRFNNKSHQSWLVINDLWPEICKLPSNGLTPFAQAMPDHLKQDNSVQAYRDYYRTKTFATWRFGAPWWWEEENA